MESYVDTCLEKDVRQSWESAWMKNLIPWLNIWNLNKISERKNLGQFSQFKIRIGLDWTW
jgi:hypothetical protein